MAGGEFVGFPHQNIEAFRKRSPESLADCAHRSRHLHWSAAPCILHDVAAVPGILTDAIRLGKQRTSLGVPLLREGVPSVSLFSRGNGSNRSPTGRSSLVSTFADQAVIAIENTRLLTEQREALEQQTATAECCR